MFPMKNLARKGLRKKNSINGTNQELRNNKTYKYIFVFLKTYSAWLWDNSL